MRGQGFRVRDKKVQKMTRDGLKEKNLTQGTEQRISGRLEEVTFGHERQRDPTAGHRSHGRTQEQDKEQRHRQLVQGTSPVDPIETVGFADATAPEIWRPVNAPSSMREAVDSPVFSGQPPSIDESPPGNGIQPQDTAKSRHGRQKKDTGGRETEQRQAGYKGEPEKTRKNRMAEKYRLADDVTPDSPDTPAVPEGSVSPRPSPADGNRRLGFGQKEKTDAQVKDRVMLKKELAVKFAADAARPDAQPIPKPQTAKEAPVSQENRRLQFEHGPRKTEAGRNRTAEKKDLARKSSAGPAEQEGASRLHYDRSELPLEERKDTVPVKAGGLSEKTEGVSGQQKKYEKAQRRVEDAEKKLEKARSKLPTRRRVRLQKQYDSGSGKVKHRLQFETETVPEYEKPSLPKRAGKAVGRSIRTAAVLKVHQKIRETERDNVGVEAAHKAESTAERVAGRALRWNKRRLHEKPYREVRRAQKRLAKANVDAAYQKLLADDPQLQKKALSKWIQKQKLKRRYAAAARETAKGAKHTTNVLTATGQVIRAMVQKVVAHKAVLGIVAVAVLIMAMSGALFSSCSAMLAGVQSAVISTCYVAEDTEIEQSELRYTELETDLQRNIDRTETDHPGYDEYRYTIGEIGHNPYELMGYLSAAYGGFTYAQVEAELDRLFGAQYTLTREEIIETRTYIDENDEEQEYDWYVLQTTLAVRPLSGIIASSLAPGDQTDRYGVYMQTCGNRQCYGDPFDLAWTAYVTSPYGYRVHPTTGAKDLHRGIDIGVAAGTPVKAVQDGRVVSAGNAGDHGLCVVIEGEDGYCSRYAHCSSISVRAGQEVKRGDTIAAVGSTGSSTEAHLHLEVTHNGQYLNPYYYVDNGGSGYLPGGGTAGMPDFPADPGAAMGDGSFAAMLTEAEKYLGFPYVWGGSSPSTSFDCSGFVSWVINHSGVGSVGRQKAQGLYNLCTPVSREDMQPGDLVFFTGTYSAATPVTHVGIYVGGGRMIHCGKPISYANIDSNAYWASHFYSGGRLPRYERTSD